MPALAADVAPLEVSPAPRPDLLAASLDTRWFSKKFSYYYKFIIPKIAKNSLKIFTVSEFSKKEIVEALGVQEEKIKITPNAVGDDFKNLAKKKLKNKYN